MKKKFTMKSDDNEAEIKSEKRLTFGQKSSDVISARVGSWSFILTFVIVIIFWISLNAFIIIERPFDPYPFILLNLTLSCVAALQAPIIMMSQNRQVAKDSLRIENDFNVDKHSNVMLKELHDEIIELKKEQKKLRELLEKNHEHMK